jgi:hypothetical protein
MRVRRVTQEGRRVRMKRAIMGNLTNRMQVLTMSRMRMGSWRPSQQCSKKLFMGGRGKTFSPHTSRRRLNCPFW